jgi:hypothetical protein
LQRAHRSGAASQLKRIGWSIVLFDLPNETTRRSYVRTSRLTCHEPLPCVRQDTRSGARARYTANCVDPSSLPTIGVRGERRSRRGRPRMARLVAVTDLRNVRVLGFRFGARLVRYTGVCGPLPLSCSSMHSIGMSYVRRRARHFGGWVRPYGTDRLDFVF